MKTGKYTTFWRASKAPITAVLASILLAAGGIASAGGSRGETVFVSGNSIPSYTCGQEGSDFALQMWGDLEGCLSVWVEGFKCDALGEYDLYRERGREVFVGSMRGEEGTFKTNYTFEAAYAKGYCETFDFSLEVGGGCTHVVRGKSGVFDRAFGVIKFIDVITNVTGDYTTGSFAAGNGINNLLYYGHIRVR
jgi:hypothetical protein